MDVYFYRIFGNFPKRLVVLHDGPADFLPDPSLTNIIAGELPFYGVEYVIETRDDITNAVLNQHTTNKVLTQQCVAFVHRDMDQNALDVTWNNPGNPVITSLRAIDSAIPATEWLRVVSTLSVRPSLTFDRQKYTERTNRDRF